MKNITNKIVLYNEKSHTKSSLQCEMREISVCLHVYWAFTHSYTLTLAHTLTHTHTAQHTGHHQRENDALLSMQILVLS